MANIRAWFSRLAGFLHGRNGDRELTAELDVHLQAHIDDNLRAGMTPDQARRKALLSALAAGRTLTSLLFGVGSADPITMAAVVALIGAVALVACYMPGRSATRVDPMVALRSE
jgi:ABC-type antimicrobial peptide transport system permease subunit